MWDSIDDILKEGRFKQRWFGQLKQALRPPAKRSERLGSTQAMGPRD
jgi:hypothetical protein